MPEEEDDEYFTEVKLYNEKGATKGCIWIYVTVDIIFACYRTMVVHFRGSSRRLADSAAEYVMYTYDISFCILCILCASLGICKEKKWAVVLYVIYLALAIIYGLLWLNIQLYDETTPYRGGSHGGGGHGGGGHGGGSHGGGGHGGDGHGGGGRGRGGGHGRWSGSHWSSWHSHGGGDYGIGDDDVDYKTNGRVFFFIVVIVFMPDGLPMFKKKQSAMAVAKFMELIVSIQIK